MASEALTYRLFGEDVTASTAFAKVGARATETAAIAEGGFGRIAKVLETALPLAAVAASVAVVKMAAQFDTQMERLHTQAGVPQAALKALGDGVLNLAGQVGIGPTSLAEALYHVESSFASTGLSAKNAMDILRTAAEGAQIGGSNLVDTTNALDATVVSGIKGVTDYTSAMGALNATVGAGDMSMQDLADAMSTGVLAVIKGYGATLQDASAALATFGDNNIRGAVAGTQLRMAVQALEVPTAKGATNLKDIGLSALDLARDMQEGGLNQALQDLTDHMNKAGIVGDKVGQFLTETFGKRAGTGVSVLMEQLDRFQSKYADVARGMGSFDAAWKAQQETLSAKWKDFTAGLQAEAVRLGHMLEPAAAGALNFASTLGSSTGDVVRFIGQQKDAVLALTLVWAAFKVQAAAAAVWSTLSSGLETVARKALEAQEALANLGGGSVLAGSAALAGIGAVAYVVSSDLLGLVSASADANRAVSNTVGQFNLKTQEGLDKARTALQEQQQQAQHSSGFWTGYFQVLTGQAGAFAKNMDVAYRAVPEALFKVQQASDNMQTNLGELSGMAGVSKEQIKALAGVLGIDLTQSFDKVLPLFQSATSKLAASSPVVGGQAAAFKKMSDEASGAADNVDKLVKSLMALYSPALADLQANDKLRDGLAHLTDNLDAHSRSLDVNTDAGRTNRGAIFGLWQEVLSAADAHAKATGKADDFNSVLQVAIPIMETTAEKVGFNKNQLYDLWNQLNVTIPQLQGQSNAQQDDATTAGAAALQTQLQADAMGNLHTRLEGLRDVYTFGVVAQTNATGILASMINPSGNTPQGGIGSLLPGHKDGGLIGGTGGPRDDNHIVRVSTGEYVSDAQTTSRWLPLLQALPKYANGGLIGENLNYSALGPFAAGFDGLVGKIEHSMLDGINKALKKLDVAALSGGGGGAAQWAPVILQVLTMLGQPASLLGVVERRINLESGGNPRAINLTDSNAAAGHPSQGLMQTIPGTFAAYAGPFIGLGIDNPLANIYAGLTYALVRYGSIAAIDPLVHPGGYAKGGFPHVNVPSLVGEQGPEIVTFGPGAQVHSNANSRRMAGGVTINMNFNGTVTGGRAGARELATMVRTELVSMKAQGFPAVGL